FAVAVLIFRSRIRLLMNFLKFVYRDKKDKMLSLVKSWKFVTAVALLAIIGFAPVRNDSAGGRFELQPANRAVVRAQIAGLVTATNAEEGRSVSAGDELIQMRNVPLQSRVARGEAEYVAATEKVRSSALRYAGLGPALLE